MKLVTRLYVEADLKEGQDLVIEGDQAHFLRAVMRLRPGQELAVFNGRDGEWLCRLTDVGKARSRLKVVQCLRPQTPPASLWLFFAPVKKSRTDFIIEKASELGCSDLFPILSDHTNSQRVNRQRLEATAREAAEQSARLDAPVVREAQSLKAALQNWPEDRLLLLADESAAQASLAVYLQSEEAQSGQKNWALLVGPEGGFSPAEFAWLRDLPFVRSVGLGPRILRAETAVVVALSLVQSAVGDWR